jgi:predicted ATPase/Tfp pilus assembly protein PilF
MLQAGDPVGRYRALHLLGRGGAAEVWAVEHATLGTRHALKLLHTPAPGLRERLLREGRLQRRLDPVCVVPVTDVIEVGGLPALVMDLVEGPTLAELLGAYRPTEEEAIALLSDVVRGVGAAHRAGVVHRDLKPSNVLLQLERGRVVPRITDFGIAKELGADGTRTLGFLGTPAYAAPEQLSDPAHVDLRADLWSLGVMLYELLTGRRPFESEQLEGLLYAVHREPTALQPLPEAMRPLVAQLLQPDRERRLASVEVLLEELQAREGAEDVLAAGGPLAEAVRLCTRPAASEQAPQTAQGWLPAEPDALLGREAELARLASLLSQARLVSVLGVGGVGKTRLALRAGAQGRPSWPGGVWFCDLTQAQSADGILAALGRTLGVALERDPAAQLGHALASRGRCLVLLDNAEQVAEPLAPLLQRWLGRAGSASFLVTSRQRLKLPPEQVLALEPLEAGAGAALFLERAAAARPGFEPSPEDHRAIAALVELLDGLPLAIELAAARVRTLSPARLRERMTDRFGVLTSRRGSDRHAALKVVLEDSWALLSAEQRTALACLSVFSGGFTLAAAEAVLSLESWAQQVLEELVDHSLVRRLGSGRLGLLVSVREFAASKLEPGSEAERRHGTFYARYGATDALRALARHGGVQRRHALAADLDDLASACRRAAQRGDGAVAAACALAAWAALELTGPIALAVELLQQARQAPGHDREVALADALGQALILAGRPQEASALLGAALEGDLSAPLLAAAGDASRAQGRMTEALHAYEAALTAARQVLDRHTEGRVLGMLGHLHREQGRGDEALAHYQQALALHEASGDVRSEALMLGSVGQIQADHGQLEEAWQRGEQALAIARALGDRQLEGELLGLLGGVRWDQGSYVEAARYYEQGLATLRQIGARREEAMMLSNLGGALRMQGQLDEGLRRSEQAVAIFRELGDRYSEVIALTNLGVAYAKAERSEEAVARYQEGLTVAREVGHRHGEGVLLGNLGTQLTRAGRLQEAQLHLQQALDLHRQTADPRNQGVVHNFFGNLERHRSAQAALAHYQAALELLTQVGDRGNLAVTHTNLGHLHRALDRDAQARSHYELALQTLREMGEPSLHAGTLCSLARLLLDAGALAEALSLLDEAAGLARGLGSSELDGLVLATRGALAWQAGDLPGARDFFERAERYLRAARTRDPLGCLLCDRALLDLAELGGSEAARERLAEVSALLEPAGSGTGMLMERRLAEVSQRLLEGAGVSS